ncbi:MAG TPA: methyltransferase domain-containing protein, partial [Chitinispirillaceae bacterium]|nr:methyltransferase domain-containing protein [Chitinispirillaceae bacterium]
QSLLISTLLESTSSILARLQTIGDLGCGSSFFAKCSLEHSLHYTVTGMDIAFESLQLAKSRNTSSIQGDLNALPFKDASFDAIIAASVLQWIEDVDTCIKALKRLIKPDGYFLFAVFTEQSFCELNAAKLDLGIPVPVNLHSGSDFVTGLASEQFKMCMSQTINQTFYFSTARDALKSISSYGATAMASKPLSHKALKELCALYEKKFSTEKGIPLTYSAIIGCAQKGDV